jgi:hypothetical protein
MRATVRASSCEVNPLRSIHFGVTRLHLTVRKRVDAEGLYVVAKRIGIAPVTLRAFLFGAPCRAGTVAQIKAAMEKTA